MNSQAIRLIIGTTHSIGHENALGVARIVGYILVDLDESQTSLRLRLTRPKILAAIVQSMVRPS
jgi:hypothetical protein